MFTIDTDMAKQAFEDRLRWAEQERLAQRMLANRPAAYARLLETLGNLLIAFGTNLKAQLPQELIKA